MRAVTWPGVPALLLGLVVVPAVLLLWLRLGTDDSLDVIDARVAPSIVTPTDRTVTDERRVTGALTWMEGSPVRAPAWSGVVTALTVKPGDVIRSGDTLLSVSGIARLGVASSAPFYRRLQPGDSGPDVSELNRALVALGYLASEPVRAQQYGTATAVAVRALQAKLGLSDADGVFDPEWFAWLPTDPFTVGAVQLELGAPAPPPGTAIAAAPPELTRVVLSPAGQGDSSVLDPAAAWVLLIGGASFPIDARTLEVPARSLPGVAKLLKPKVERLDGIVQRAVPLKVIAIPSTAVTTGPGGGLCVWLEARPGEYRPQAVTLAGSRAGVTNVAEGLSAGSRLLANPAGVLSSTACP